jgi:hypothetical protein
VQLPRGFELSINQFAILRTPVEPTLFLPLTDPANKLGSSTLVPLQLTVPGGGDFNCFGLSCGKSDLQNLVDEYNSRYGPNLALPSHYQCRRANSTAAAHNSSGIRVLPFLVCLHSSKRKRNDSRSDGVVALLLVMAILPAGLRRRQHDPNTYAGRVSRTLTERTPCRNRHRAPRPAHSISSSHRAPQADRRSSSLPD